MSVLRFSEPKKSIIFVVILQNCRKNITNFSKRDKLNVTTSSRQTKNVKPGVSFWNTLSAYLISETFTGSPTLRFEDDEWFSSN